MTKLRFLEFWVRILAWLGVWVLETATLWERMLDKEYSIFTIITLWMVVLATYLAGIFDMFRFSGKIK